MVQNQGPESIQKMTAPSSQRPRAAPYTNSRSQRLSNLRAAVRKHGSQATANAPTKRSTDMLNTMSTNMQPPPQTMTAPPRGNAVSQDQHETDVSAADVSLFQSLVVESKEHTKTEVGKISLELNGISSLMSQLINEIQSTRQEIDQGFQHHKNITESLMDILKEALEMDEIQYGQAGAGPEQEDFMDPALFEQDTFHH